MTQYITGELLKKMIANAAVAIENHKDETNELNVFPVPDGDTGTNLSLTMNAAAKAMASTSPKTLGEAVDVMASAMLRGARGNSGVILSLLFRGFSKWLKDLDTANAENFAHALANGVDSAYKAVMKPAEGTMLTVSRLLAGAAVRISETEEDIEVVLEQALEAGYIALDDTINQNPVLKKAGVVDAGAKGYLYMIDGMLRAMRGEVMERSAEGSADTKSAADFAQFHEEDITFTYCTEFMITKGTNANPPIRKLQEFLDSIGDSVVAVDDEEIIKVHVHTDDPGAALTKSLEYGAIASLSVKIENMREQHAEMTESASSTSVPQEPEEMKEYAIVAVCAGAGIAEVFSDLGADRIITGGQTMNPSTEDILEKISNAPSDIVFVLPNNKNIIMAAQQCEKLSDKQVVVIPTKSIPQGVSALLSLDGSGSVEDMTESMKEAASRVKTALVTKAARDSVFDDMEIKNDEYLALIEDSLAAHGDDENEIFDVVAKALNEFSPEFITVFTGEDAGEAETDALIDKINEVSNGVEVAMINGGQPVYHYIISAE